MIGVPPILIVGCDITLLAAGTTFMLALGCLNALSPYALSSFVLGSHLVVMCRQLYFESMDPDRYTRRVQPVSVTGIGPSNTTSSNSTLNCYEDHRWDFDYTSGLRLSRFGAVVENGGVYSVLYAGTPPQQQQFSLSGNAPEEGVVVKIKCVAASNTACHRLCRVKHYVNKKITMWATVPLHLRLRLPHPIRATHKSRLC